MNREGARASFFYAKNGKKSSYQNLTKIFLRGKNFNFLVRIPNALSIFSFFLPFFFAKINFGKKMVMSQNPSKTPVLARKTPLFA